MQAFAITIFETLRHPLNVLDLGLNALIDNPAFFCTFRGTVSSTEGRDFYVIDICRWHQPHLRTFLLGVILRDGSFKEVEYECANLDRREMVPNAHRVGRAEGSTQLNLLAIEDDTERRWVRNELRRLNYGLESGTFARTAELMMSDKELLDANRKFESANRKLEACCYSVSRHLRSPPKVADGFSEESLHLNANQKDEKGQQYLKRNRAGTQRMDHLFDDLLKVSWVTRASVVITTSSNDDEDLIGAYDLSLNS